MLVRLRGSLAGLLLAGALAGCGVQAVNQGLADAATTVSQTLSQASLDQLTAQLPSIEQAVQAGQTEEARAAFAIFLQVWDMIKLAAQQIAPTAATGIQSAMDQVKQTLIDTPTPNAADVQAALAELKRQFNGLNESLN